MRTIRFRAWHEAEMYIVNTLGMDNDGINRSMSFAHKNDQNKGIKDGDCVMFNIYTEFMQFTGLTDKNGKEIYEGDVIEVDNEENPALTSCKHYKGCFILEDNAGVHWTRQLLPQPERLTVIGNIYENPELLKQ